MPKELLTAMATKKLDARFLKPHMRDTSSAAM
jgi:hypothetical protein